jgi:hypothetical protein
VIFSSYFFRLLGRFTDYERTADPENDFTEYFSWRRETEEAATEPLELENGVMAEQ